MAVKKHSRRSGKRTVKKGSARKRNVFAGADDVYLTERSIAVRRVSTSKSRNGRAVLQDKTTYVPRTKANLEKANSIFGRLRFGRK